MKVGVTQDDWEDYLDRLAVFGMRPGLERVSALLDALGRPQDLLRVIHIVGTNGKSSATRYAAALLQAHGLRAGAYLSPHITGYRERVLVDGAPVDAGRFGRAVGRVRDEVGRLPSELGETTQFEVLTVAALLALAESGVEAVALEAGLGGRLDATNVVDAPVVVLTNIALEHTAVLGDTRALIFAEKAAVIKGGDAVFGPLDGLERAAEEVCASAGARAHLLGRTLEAVERPEDRVAAFDHSGLLGEDQRPCVAEHRSVLEGDVGQDDDGRIDHVRRVEPAAEPGLERDRLHPALGQGEQSRHREHLELGRLAELRRQPPDLVAHAPDGPAEPASVHRRAVDEHALAVPRDVG